MKRLLICFLCLLLLCACGRRGECLVVTPHEEQYVRQENEDALVISDYDSLVSALLYLVSSGEPEGLIRSYSYPGSVSDEVADAVYQVAKRTPLGSFAVDYITYECVQVVSYYEITVGITYSKSPEEMDALITTRGENAIRTRVASALEHYAPSLSLYVYGYEDLDLGEFVRSYYEAHPESVQAMPEVRASFDPAPQSECILQLELGFPETSERMQAIQAEVEEEAQSAAEYVQHRETQAEQLQLLYSYLSEHFDYEIHSTPIPVHGALCQGVASSVGFARAMKILCDRLEMDCYVVQGVRDGSDWSWNIVKVDGQFYHVDVMQALLQGSDELPLSLDAAMSAYHWTTADYPSCALRPDDWPELGSEPGENIRPGT